MPKAERKAMGDMAPEDGEAKGDFLSRCQDEGNDADMCAMMWDDAQEEGGEKSASASMMMTNPGAVGHVNLLLETGAYDFTATVPATGQNGEEWDPKYFLGVAKLGSIVRPDFAYPVIQDETLSRAAIATAIRRATKNGHADVAATAIAMLAKLDALHTTKTKSAGQGMKRGYSLLSVKGMQEREDERIIIGTATAPSTDRMGDIVESMGVNFTNPTPLLHQHKADQPVGIVEFDKPTKNGVTFRATLPRITEPGPLRDRVETAWGELKHGLIRGVSIGFRPLADGYEIMKGGGIHYKNVEVLELSLVTVPAQAEATISVIRSVDHQVLAASGRTARTITDTTKSPGVTGTSTNNPVIAQERKHTMAKKSLAEQIASYEGTRMAKAARMDDIMDNASDRGETLDAQEKDEYQGLDVEVKSIDDHLVMLRDREKRAIAQAKVVDGSSAKAGSDSRGDGGTAYTSKGLGNGRVQLLQRKMLPGTDFVRYVMCLAKAKGNVMQAHEYAKHFFMDSSPDVEMVLRVAVSSGLTSDDPLTSSLVYYSNMASEFIEYLRPLTIMGRINGLRMVPFNVKVPRQTTTSTVNWVGETAPKPVSSLVFDQVTLGHAKIAGIIPISDELLRFSNPSIEQIIRNDLASNIANYMDIAFVDPSKTAVTNVSPASITSGVTAIPATGSTAAALRLDLQSLLDLFLRDNLSPVGGVFIMTQQQALAISLMLNTLGQPVFPAITMEGGSLLGFPVVASEAVPSTGGSPTDGSAIIFVKAGEVLVADDGGVNIDVSNEASLQMDTAPDSPTLNTTILVSLWQQNMTAIRAEREVNWVKRRSDACQYISNAKYTS